MTLFLHLSRVECLKIDGCLLVNDDRSVPIVAFQALKNHLELHSLFYQNRRHRPKWEDAPDVRVHHGSDEGQRHLVGDLNPAIELH